MLGWALTAALAGAPAADDASATGRVEAHPSDHALVYYNARMALREGEPLEAVKLWYLRNALERHTHTVSAHDEDFRSVTWAALGELGICQDGFPTDDDGAGLWPLALHNWVVENMSRRVKPKRARLFQAFEVGRQQRFVSIDDVLSPAELRSLHLFKGRCTRPRVELVNLGEAVNADLSDRQVAANLLHALLERARGTVADERVRGRAAIEARLFDVHLQLAALSAQEARRDLQEKTRRGRQVGLSRESVAEMREEAPTYNFGPESEQARILRGSLAWPASEWMTLSPDRRLFLFDRARAYVADLHSDIPEPEPQPVPVPADGPNSWSSPSGLRSSVPAPALGPAPVPASIDGPPSAPSPHPPAPAPGSAPAPVDGPPSAPSSEPSPHPSAPAPDSAPTPVDGSPSAPEALDGAVLPSPPSEPSPGAAAPESANPPGSSTAAEDHAALDHIALGVVDELVARGEGEQAERWIARVGHPDDPAAREVIWGGERGQRLLTLDRETGFRERAVIALHRGIRQLEEGDLPSAMRSMAYALQHAPDSRAADEVQALSRRWMSYLASQFEITDDLLVTLQQLVPRRDYAVLLEDLMWRAAFRADRSSFERGVENQLGRDALERRIVLLHPLARGDVGWFASGIRDGLTRSPSETLRFLDQLVQRLELEDADVRAAQVPTLLAIRRLLTPVAAAGATGSGGRTASALLDRSQSLLEGLGELGVEATARDRARSLSPDGEVYAGSVRLAPSDPLPWPFTASEVAAPSIFVPIRLTPEEWPADASGEWVFGWSIGG